MRLILTNVGIIESADIELKGLTVIAGNNDTGKSTVGKIVYSLTKAYQDFEIKSIKEKNNLIQKYFREIYSLIRGEVSLEKENIKKLFNNIAFFGRRIDSKDILQLVREGKEVISAEEIKNEIKEKILTLFNQIEIVYKKEETKSDKILSSLKGIMSSEFIDQITNFASDNAQIEVYDGENKIIKFSIEKGIMAAELKDKIFPFESSIFIETPLVLSYADSFEIADETYHIEDLLTTLKNSSVYKEKEESSISRIIDGKFYFNEDEDTFEFKKKFGNKSVIINMKNVASGIRNFGLLQLLEKAGEFNKNLLLVIDEPEVHLHPDWQVEYAKVLISLIKRGVKVLVTSHSPYLIEALNKYSQQEGLIEKTKFYLAEKIENGNSIIKDKTKDKDEIFEKLSKPFEKLIFGK